MEYFLATTALTEFWDFKKEIVILDDFCKTFNRKEHTINFIELKECNYSKESFLKSISYCTETYESLLYLLTNWLNEIHGENHSVRYWRILIGPFLMWYTEILFEKYRRINYALCNYPNLSTFGLETSNYYTPNDTLEFTRLSFEDDLWNLQLTTQVIHFINKNIIKYKQPKQINIKVEQNSINYNKIKNTFKTFYKKTLTKIISNVNFNSTVILYLPTLNIQKKIRITLSSDFKFWPYYNSQIELKYKRQININVRRTLKNLQGIDKFSNLVIDSLVTNLPQIFLEGYKNLKEKSLHFHKSHKLKIIVCDVGWYYDEIFKIWAATKSEIGSKLITVQHGGAYGSSIHALSETHEKKISDYFFSWGWTDSNKVIAMSALRFTKSRKTTKERTSILFASTSYPRFYGPTCIKMYDYLDFQFRFAISLSNRLFSNLELRLFLTDYGWGVESFWKEKLPNLKIDRDIGDRKSFFKKISECKIFVTDSQSTTFLQAISLNVPSILFFDTEQDLLRESAIPFYDELIGAGIFHTTPESAAQMVDKIYDNVSQWWNSEKVQNARLKFCTNFFNNDEHWALKWNHQLNSILFQ